MERALGHFDEAIRLDATLALAHSGISATYQMLADAYMSPLEAVPRATAAAERALELDPALAEAWADLGMVRGGFERHWSESEAALARAVELNPNLPEAYLFRAWNLVALRDAATAVPHFERGFALDPLSAFASMMLGWGYVYSGRFDDAIRQWGVTQELSPGMVYIDSQLGMALRDKGEYETALRAFEEVEPALGRPSTGRVVTLARMGRVEEARRLARELEEVWARAYFIPEFLADVFVALGDLDRAIHWLERGLEEHSAGVQRLRVRDFAPLYSDPRYLDILKRAGLPPPPTVHPSSPTGAR
jgi:serine/threonine-protein kinase